MYPMDQDMRGEALIFCLAYHNTDSPMTYSGEKEAKFVTKLFEWLKFKVTVYTDDDQDILGEVCMLHLHTEKTFV